jgi:hypothetical protein
MFKPLFDISATLAPPLTLGPAATGERRMIAITGGRVTGRVEAEILPGGADWQVVRPDGLADIDARYLLRTRDGATVEVWSRGLRHGTPEAMRKLVAGEPVDPSQYYFRTALRFESAAPSLHWLTRVLAVGVGERRPDAVLIRAFEVL